VLDRTTKVGCCYERELTGAADTVLVRRTFVSHWVKESVSERMGGKEVEESGIGHLYMQFRDENAFGMLRYVKIEALV
jgi:hypothetical protein